MKTKNGKKNSISSSLAEQSLLVSNETFSSRQIYTKHDTQNRRGTESLIDDIPSATGSDGE